MSANGLKAEGGVPPAVDDANTVPLVETPGDDAATATTVPTTILKATSTKSPTPASELLRSDAGDVAATTVAMERSGADHITAQRVTMSRSGARSLETRSAQLDRSGVLSLRSDHAVLHAGSAVGVVANEVRIVNGKTLVVSAKTATIDDGAHIFLYSGPPSPGLRPALDTAGAAAFGTALGLALLLLGPLLRRLLR